jgi:hypothetical protein
MEVTPSKYRATDSEDIKGIVKPYDWTYTTPYRGDITPNVLFRFAMILTKDP